MKTRRLTQTELFTLLSTDGPTKVVTLSELAPAYDEFTDVLIALSDDTQYTTSLRCLYYTRTELHALQKTSHYKAGKKSAHA